MLEAEEEVSMSMDFAFRPVEDVLIAEVTGKYSLEEACSSFLKLLDYLKQNPARRVLIDTRGLQRDRISSMDDYMYAEFVAKHSFSSELPQRPLYLAYLIPESRIESSRFPEDVAANRGVILRVFSREEDALAWLRR